MMRRLSMGILWFLVLAAALFLLLQLVIALYIMVQTPKGAGQAAMVQYATDFAASHAGVIRALDSLTLVAAVLLAGFGTMRGMLPGTRKRG
jgi:preprotein translocase subunit SecG